MKKRIGIIVAMVLSLSIFTLTALASSNSLEGYELLKDVMQADTTSDYTNGTVDYSLSVSDNGTILFDTSGTISGDEASEMYYAQGVISDGSLEKSFEVSGNKTVAYFKDVENNLIYQFSPSEFEDESDYDGHGSYDDRMEDRNHKMTKSEERLFDALVGDMKNKVTLTELSDGRKEIGLSLNQSDIPLPVNLLLAVAAENEQDNGFEDEDNMDAYIALFPFLDGFDCQGKDMPALKDQVGIVSLDLNTTVNAENQIEGFAFTLVMDGIDENGDYHVVSVSASLNVVNVGQTVVGSVDTNGEIIVIDTEAIKALESKH